MPKKKNRELQDFSKYDAMTSEELAQILRLDSEAPEGNGLDIDSLLYITEVLAERNQNITGKTAQEAWDSFQNNYLPSENVLERTKKAPKQRKLWVRHAIAAAAVVALILVIPFSTKALNWKRIWETVASWTTGTFFFASDDQSGTDTPTETGSRPFGSLRSALSKIGIGNDFNSTWIPEEFQLKKIIMDESSEMQIYIAHYEDGKRTMSISVQTHDPDAPIYRELNNNSVEIYEVSDVKYYIFSNNGWNCATWMIGSYEYEISGEITVEDIKNMIDSISKG